MDALAFYPAPDSLGQPGQQLLHGFVVTGHVPSRRVRNFSFSVRETFTSFS